MLRLLFTLPIVLALACSLCAAQDQPRAQGYVFAAPGGQLSTTPQLGTIHLGGGGEGFLYKGLAVGGRSDTWRRSVASRTASASRPSTAPITSASATVPIVSCPS